MANITQHLQAGQIKAARAMLDWTREHLAAATGLSLNTIRNLEAGMISPRNTTNSIIRQVIESKGLEFTDYEGVRRRPTDVLQYQGHDGADKFFDDLLQTSKQRGGDVFAVCISPEMFLQTIGASKQNLSRLQELSVAADVKCLLSECRKPSLPLPAIQCRAISKLHVCPTPYFVYGDRVGFVMTDSGLNMKFIIVQSATTARHWGGHFVELWNEAAPLL